MKRIGFPGKCIRQGLCGGTRYLGQRRGYAAPARGRVTAHVVGFSGTSKNAAAQAFLARH